MKKYLICLITLKFLFAGHAHAAKITAQLNAGKTFHSKLGKFEAPSGGIGHGNNTTATINKNPISNSTYGIDALLFFNETFGVNLGAQYSSYKVADSIITLIDPTAPTIITGFPGFTNNVSSIHGGFILKKRSIISPYAGVALILGIGRLNNTKFSLNPTEYGKGGNKSGLIMLGGMIKAGLNYHFKERMQLGIEYRYQYLNITNSNQQFRSFNKGFKGSLKSSVLLVQLGYTFNI